MKILMIDDDPDDREFFQIALEEAGISCTFNAVESWKKALNLLHSSEEFPDYIFLDLNMPATNGRECLVMLKSNSRFKDIPVVIYSTSADPIDKRETLGAGAMAFLTKPSKISELIILLSNFFNHHSINHNEKHL